MAQQVIPEDIALALGRPSPTPLQAAQWATWITDAYLILRAGDGSHAGLGDLTALDDEVVRYVVREAVVAHVRRPEDATQVDVSVDDGRVSKTYTSAAGRVSILPAWWAMLDPATDDEGSFSIGPEVASTGYTSGAYWPPAWPR